MTKPTRFNLDATHGQSHYHEQRIPERMAHNEAKAERHALAKPRLK